MVVVCVIATVAALATRMIDVDVRDEVLMAVMSSLLLLLELPNKADVVKKNYRNRSGKQRRRR